MATSGTLTKLKISAVDNSNSFSVMINPETYTIDHNINYDTKNKPLASTDYDLKYVNYDPVKVSFDLYLDGTGIVSADDVGTKITALKKVIYNYVGTEHQPSKVEIAWGTLIFKGRLESMNINYTLFKPDGTPLRAKIGLSFLGFMDANESAKKKNNSSPDMSHIRTVLHSSSLALMCKEVYKDESMYIEVAKANSLISFRRLEIGTQIYLPPIKKS